MPTARVFDGGAMMENQRIPGKRRKRGYLLPFSVLFPILSVPGV